MPGCRECKTEQRGVDRNLTLGAASGDLLLPAFCREKSLTFASATSGFCLTGSRDLRVRRLEQQELFRASSWTHRGISPSVSGVEDHDFLSYRVDKYRLTEYIAVVGSNLSGVGKSVISDLFENTRSIELASETRAIIAKVVLGSGVNQEYAKNLCTLQNSVLE
jgi:hypothetical protein